MTDPRADFLEKPTGTSLEQSVLHTTRDDFLRSMGISEDLITSTSQADVLILPDYDAHGVAQPTFPTQTHELFLDLKDSLGRDVVDIAVTDDEYAEISLHHDLITLPTMLITIPLGVVANAIWHSIKARLGRRIGKSRVKVTFIALDTPTTRLRKFEYDGPAEMLLDTLSKANDTSEK